MNIYYWIAGIGVIGLIDLIGFCAFTIRDLRLIRLLRKKKATFLVNSGLLILSILCFSLMVVMFLSLKEQVMLLS